MIIKSGESSANVEEMGGYITQMKLSGNDLLLPGDMDNKTHGGCAILFPYPNRIRDATYTWNGRKYRLPVNSTPNAIHGLLNGVKLTGVMDGENCLVMRGSIVNEGYPSILEISVKYTISEQSMKLDLSATNAGDQSCPVAFGIHPYFLHGGSWSLETMKTYSFLKYVDSYFPDGSTYPVWGDLLNSGSGKAFDNCFELHDDLSIDFSNCTVTLSGNMNRYYVVYNGRWCKSVSVAVEPMSAAPDSFNNGLGLEILEPGKTMEFRESIICMNRDQK